MKKQLMLVGITVILIAAGLSGCTEDAGNTETNTHENNENNGDNDNSTGNISDSHLTGNWTLSTYEGEEWEHFNRLLRFNEDGQHIYVSWNDEEGTPKSVSTLYVLNDDILTIRGEPSDYLRIRNYTYTLQDETTLLLTPEGKDVTGTYIKEAWRNP